jgi:predicted Zn-dependent peptidase
MEYQHYDEKAYNLHLFKTDKFKTITVMINFRRKIVKEEITIRSFINSLLLLSSKNYPSEKLSCQKLESLYSPQIGGNERRLGNYAITSFYINMLNEKYLDEGINKECLNFFKELIFNPDVTDGAFNARSFNIVKNDIKAKLRSIKDNPKYYSAVRMLEVMAPDSSISYRNGYLDDLNDIDAKKVYDYYKSMLNSDIIDVFVLGDIDTSEIRNMIRDMIAVNTIKKQKKDIYVTHHEFRSRIKKVVEEEGKLLQAKLVIGYKVGYLSDFERKYVLPIYNDILGGPSYSKLFQNVREKNSLAYYVYSNYSRGDNILTISSGINKESFDKALRLIKQEFNNISKGKIIDSELIRAQEDMNSIIKQIEDKPLSLINNYVVQLLFDLDSIETRKKEIFKVTKEDVKNISKKIHIDTVYFLHGGDTFERDTD